MMSGCKEEIPESGHVAARMTTLETLTQKLKVEPTDEEKPPSAAALAVAKQQIPKTDQNAGELLIDKVANVRTSHNEVKILPNDLKWTPAMIFDWDFEDEDDEPASAGNAEVEAISESDAET